MKKQGANLKAVPFNPSDDKKSGDTLIPQPKSFVFKPVSQIPRRSFLCGPAYQKGQVTLTIAAPGAGKTSLGIAEAVHLAAGEKLFDPCKSPFRVWLFNGEEPIVELERRIAGAVAKHMLPPEVVGSNLFFNSGLETRLMFGPRQSDEAANDDIANLLIAALRGNQIDILIIDPFVSTHAEQENDNVGIDYVSKLWSRIANEAGCAIHLVHHTRKSGFEALTAESVRGASSLVATARFVRTLTPLSATQSGELGCDNGAVKIEVVKSNNSRAGAIRQFAIESYDLGNSSDGERGDDIGVITVIDPDAPRVALVDPGNYPAIEAAFAKPLRADSQVAGWAGEALAGVLGLHAMKNAQLNSRLKYLIDVGILHRWIAKGSKGRPVPWIGLRADAERGRPSRPKARRGA